MISKFLLPLPITNVAIRFSREKRNPNVTACCTYVIIFCGDGFRAYRN